ncbi:sodium:sulfate symporter transmembrane region family protein, partial [Chlamydia psittaci 06-1683]
SQLVSIKDWWQSGFVLSIVNIAIWVGIGSLWWKILGLI